MSVHIVGFVLHWSRSLYAWGWEVILWGIPTLAGSKGLIMDQADREELARLLTDPPINDQGFVAELIDRFLTKRGYVRADKIIGMKEASVLTGVPLSTLASRTWRRTPGWPAPVRTVAAGPLFDRDAVLSARVDPQGRSSRSQNGRTVIA